MTTEQWQAIKQALTGGNWLTEEQGRQVVEEMEHSVPWKSIAEKLEEERNKARVDFEAAQANIKIVLDSAARTSARLQHTHDAANALYQAVGTLLVIIEATPFDLVRCTDEQRKAFLDTLDDVEKALDPQQAAAALQEVQRRDGLDREVTRLRALVSAAGGDEGLSAGQLVRWFEEAGTEREKLQRQVDSYQALIQAAGREEGLSADEVVCLFEKQKAEIDKLTASELEWRREREELLGRLRAAEARADVQLGEIERLKAASSTTKSAFQLASIVLSAAGAPEDRTIPSPEVVKAMTKWPTNPTSWEDYIKAREEKPAPAAQEPRPQLTKKAARPPFTAKQALAWGTELFNACFDGTGSNCSIAQALHDAYHGKLPAALQQAARGEWATPPTVGVEAITHEFRPGAYPVVDPIERETVPITAGAPALTITLAAPSPAKSTREIHEELIRQWEQAAAHEGAPIEPPAHDTAEMAVTTVEGEDPGIGAKQSDCEHERTDPDLGAFPKEARCLDCLAVFRVCPGCSEGGGAGMPIYHTPPLCKTTAEEQSARKEAP